MLKLVCAALLTTSLYGWTLLDYDPKPNAKSVVQPNNSTRFTIISPFLIRMEYDDNGNFEDRASTAIVNRYNSPPAFDYSITGSQLKITTDYLTLQYALGEHFGPDSLSISGQDANGFAFNYVPSGDPFTDNSHSGNLLGTIRSLDKITGPISLNCSEIRGFTVHGESLHCTWAPFGRKGFAILNDTNTTMMDGDWVSPVINANSQDWYFFGHGLDYKRALYDFHYISGAIPLVPRYSLGVMHCRWYDYSDWSIREAVREHESRHLPYDVNIIDMDWHHYGEWGSYTYNYHLFPYPEKMAHWFHEKGIRMSANLHDADGITHTQEQYQAAATALNFDTSNNADIIANFTDQPYMEVLEDIVLYAISERESTTPSRSSSLSKAVSAQSQATERRFRAQVARGKLAEKRVLQEATYTNGFDFWWIDWQQGQYWGIYYSKVNPTIQLNYMRATDHIRRNENVRGMVLARYGGYGNQRYQVGFSGDVGHTWSTLNFEPYFSATGANVGYIYWSHDIMGAADDYELNTRWIQFGAFSGIFRTHDAGKATGSCADSNSGCPQVDIWDHPWKNFNIERTALQLRQAMLPYMYNASYEAFTTGSGYMSPLYHYFPTSNEAYTNGHQYMLGDTLMVAPVTVSSGGDFKLADWTIWLPPGQWYEHHSGKVLQGDQSLARSFALSEIPMYSSVPSVFVCQPFDAYKAIGRAGQMTYDHLQFSIYPATGVTQGYTSIYEDDGYTFDYLDESDDSHVRTSFNWQLNGNHFQSTIASKGTYAEFPAQRRYSVAIHNVFPPNAVRCAGQSLAYDDMWYGRTSFADGWFYDSIRMSVIVNCPQHSTTQSLSVEMDFGGSWNNYIVATDGIKGKIARAKLAKDTLDEANVAYGSERSNLTDAEAYGLRLGDVGSDLATFTTLVSKFNDIFAGAIDQVTALRGVNQDRHQYAIDLLSTI